jgi:hypothetical protein
VGPSQAWQNKKESSAESLTLFYVKPNIEPLKTLQAPQPLSVLLDGANMAENIAPPSSIINFEKKKQYKFNVQICLQKYNARWQTLPQSKTHS